MRIPSTSYHAVHHRLRRTRGPASAQLCACGNRASAWAYDRSDLNELTEWVKGGGKVIYSADLERYQPMCTPCHHTLDHPPRTSCKRGHEYTPENTYIRTNGWYFCKTCRRDLQRQWRAAHPQWRDGKASA